MGGRGVAAREYSTDTSQVMAGTSQVNLRKREKKNNSGSRERERGRERGERERDGGRRDGGRDGGRRVNTQKNRCTALKICTCTSLHNRLA